MAVDLAKLSLWLATLAKDHPFTFVDHTLRCGDSLVGLTRKQIVGFDLNPSAQLGFVEKEVRDRMNSVANQRKMILDAGDNMLPGMKLAKLKLADEALSLVRLAGDAVVAAFFAADKPKQRKEIQTRHFESLEQWIQNTDFSARRELQAAIEELKRPRTRSNINSVVPFHWQIEFPEAFTGEAPGFDAFVGNPPFLGGTRISEVAGMSYFQLLTFMYPPCEHHCDLVAYFLRRCFDHLRRDGCFGLITTNTVAQGDTREGGLLTILRSSGQIYSATTRYRWPGQAAVIVSVIHVSKCNLSIVPLLNGKPVTRISAYLMNGKMDDSPKRLSTNPYFSLGSKIYGQGFLFADDDSKCTPLAVRDEILAKHPDWEGRMKPYLVGEEINSDPRQKPKRFVIYLSDIQEEDELDAFPELRDIVKAKVYPERMVLGNNPNNIPLKKRWWAYQAHRPELYEKLSGLTHATCLSRVGQALAFARVPTNIVFSEAVVVIAVDAYAYFAILQSRVHDIWARYFASSMKDDLRYTPSDCFETFPFPPEPENIQALNEIGMKYERLRSEFLLSNEVGLTSCYNSFNDPNNVLTSINKLREMHSELDAMVLGAYGWEDIAKQAKCEFFLDYEDEVEDADEGTPSRRKKPWRYRWPDDLRDIVLARLLELNEQLAADERRSGAAAEVKSTSNGSRKKSTKKVTSEPTPLLDKDGG